MVKIIHTGTNIQIKHNFDLVQKTNHMLFGAILQQKGPKCRGKLCKQNTLLRYNLERTQRKS